MVWEPDLFINKLLLESTDLLLAVWLPVGGNGYLAGDLQNVSSWPFTKSFLLLGLLTLAAL